jgi:hypothetical protein
MISVAILFVAWFNVIGVSFFAISIRKVLDKLEPVNVFNINVSKEELLNSFTVVQRSFASPCIQNANTYATQTKMRYILNIATKESIKNTKRCNEISNQQYAVIKPEQNTIIELQEIYCED